jgi:hypothetical protein
VVKKPTDSRHGFPFDQFGVFRAAVVVIPVRPAAQFSPL